MISFNVVAERENEFAFRLSNLRDLVQRGLVDPEIGTLRKQSQLLTEHCMRLTPPKSTAQGKTAVAADMRKIFHPIDPDSLTSPRMAALVRRGDATAWDAFARHITKGPLKNTVAIIPTEALHQANRNARGRGLKTNFVTLTPQAGTLRQLITAAQTAVGWARAGWLRAYLELGGTRAPEWVMRHVPGKGTITDTTRATSNDRPYIAVNNNTGWGAGRAESERIVSAALRARGNAMKTYFETMMGLAAKGTPTAFQAQQALIAQAFDIAA